MLSSVAWAALAVLGVAVAQSSSLSQSPSPSGTGAAASATHTVAVGADGLNFSPRQVNASVGDIIEFRFYPRNHSVARAAFKQPCIPIEDTGRGLVGFWSGFRPVDSVLPDPPIFRLPINDTDPVFFYCSAPNACYDGMVGVINPNSTFTFQTQFDFSQNATESFSPLEYFPIEAAPSRSSNPSSAATSSPTNTPPPNPDKKPLSTGAIIGIVLGAVVIFVLLATLLYMCGKQKGLREITSVILPRSNPGEEHPQGTYIATSPGMSEAHYPNMRDSGFAPVESNPHASGRFSHQSYGSPNLGADSYRSFSPNVDERTGMLQSPTSARDGRFPGGQSSPGLRSGYEAAGSGPNSPGLQSPSPPYVERHEMDEQGSPEGRHQVDPSGPHEMGVPSRNPSAATPPNQPRPFSYVADESQYRPDEKR